MASTNKKNTGNRRNSGNRRNTGNQKNTGNRNKSGKPQAKRKKQTSAEVAVEAEIILWMILAVSVLLLISNFGIGGALGSVFSSFFFGLVGLLCYPLPIFLFLGSAFLIANGRNPRAYRKIFGFLVFFTASCMLMQLLTEGTAVEKELLNYYHISAEYKTGGGLLGGLLSRLCVTAFGAAGTYVITVVAIMISLVLMTQKSMFDMLRKISKWIYANASEKKARRAEAARIRKEQAEAEYAEYADEEEDEYEEEESDPRLKKKAAPSARKKISQRELEITEKKPATVPQQNNRTDIKPETKSTLSKELKPFASFAEHSKEDAPFVPENAFPIQRAEHLMQDIEEIAVIEDGLEEIIPEKKQEIRKDSELLPAEKQEEEHKGKKPHSSKEEIERGIDDVKKEIATKEAQVKREYQVPPLTLLERGKNSAGDSDKHLRETARKLQDTLHNFGVNVSITNVSCGPTVTRYELQPEQGVKVSKIVSLTDDIKLNLAATDIRIEAPIPGKAAVGIEVPNAKNTTVMLRELLQSEAFQKHGSKLAFAAGKDIAGKPVIADIAKMPHLLIAGATGSGKSVCINTLIMSILYKASPDDVKLIMIDPKVVELSVYNGIPHLFIPVVTDPKKAAGALNWAVAEMTDRYNKFAEYNVRDLKGYNAKVDSIADIEDDNKPKKMPQIVIIVDELADLMMVAPGEVEDSICRLAQLARAAGIHLIIATQRPSVNVITGLIKANMPSRIAFSVSSGVDSRTILDMNGAEKLLGKGDMLFYPQGYQKPARVQGAFVSDQEVQAVVEFLSEQHPAAEYDKEIQQKIDSVKEAAAAGASSESDRDAYFTDAGKFIIEKEKASIGMLQRVFKIGFNRAARIMDQLCEAGVVGEEEGTKPRKVLMSMEEFEQFIDEYL